MTSSSEARSPVRTIDREELRQKLALGDALKLVMMTSDWGFRVKHLPGSLHFKTPTQVLGAGLGKSDEIVLYCSNVDCHASVAAYHALVDHGYQNVRHYAGGLIDWESAGLPLEGEWAAGARGE